MAEQPYFGGGAGVDLGLTLVGDTIIPDPGLSLGNAANQFKDLYLKGDSLYLGAHTLVEETAEADEGLGTAGSLHIGAYPGGGAANLCMQEGTEPIPSMHGDHQRIWYDTNHNLLWQDHTGISRIIHAAGGNAPGQWVLTGTDIYYDAGKVGVGMPASVHELEVGGDVLVQGVDGFDSADETATVFFGDEQNYIQAIYGDLCEIRAYVGWNISDRYGVIATFVEGKVSLYGELDIGANKLTVNSMEVVGADGEINKAVVEDSDNWDTAYKLAQNMQTTGLISGAVITKASDTTLDISSGTGLVADYSDPANPVTIPVTYSGVTGYTPVNLATDGTFIIAIDSVGSLVELSSGFSNQDKRDNILVGIYIAKNGTILAAIDAPFNIGYNGMGSVSDFIRNVIGPANVNGNIISPNGVNLNLNTNGGKIFIVAANFRNNPEVADEVTISSGAVIPFMQVFRQASPSTQLDNTGAPQTEIDPDRWDDGSGVLATVPANKFTVQVLYVAPNESYWVAYGQEVFNTLSDAETALLDGTLFFEEYPFEMGIVRRSFIIIKEGTTDLSDISNTKFFADGKFRMGGIATSGGTISPGGIDGNIQFNDNGAFGGSNDLVWVEGSSRLEARNLSVNGVVITGYIEDLQGATTDRIPYGSSLGGGFTDSNNLKFSGGALIVLGDIGIGMIPSTYKAEVAGDVLVQGVDGFDSADETATVYLGDANHFFRAIYGGLGELHSDDGVKISNSVGTIATFKNSFGGIGTVDPQLPWDVRSEDDNQIMAFDTTAQAQGTGGGYAFGGYYTDAGAESMAGRIGVRKTNGVSGDYGFGMIFQTQTNGGIITDRIEILSNGYVGVDTTPTVRFDVNGDTKIRGDITVDNDVIVTNDIRVMGKFGAGNATPEYTVDVYVNRISGVEYSARFVTDGNDTGARGLFVQAGEDIESGTNRFFDAWDGDGNTLTGYIASVNGVLGIYDVSDGRLKTKIRDTRINANKIINGLRVREFEWKKNPGRQITGFIAQEVKNIYSDAVSADPDTGMYSLSKAALIPPLILFVQELEKRITALEGNVPRDKLQSTGLRRLWENLSS